MERLARISNAFWANLGSIALIVGWVLCAGTFAWAVNATKLFEAYAPLSWVFAAFFGAGLAAAIWRLGISAQLRLIQNRYDAKLLAQGGAIDPMAKTFDSKRIYLNEFALPSKPLIENKTFIDCEIIGPANVFMIEGNVFSDHRLPACDALALAPGADPTNGYAFRNCVFRGCSFVRITVMIAHPEFHSTRYLDWLRWISPMPELPPELQLEPSQTAFLLSAQTTDA